MDQAQTDQARKEFEAAFAEAARPADAGDAMPPAAPPAADVPADGQDPSRDAGYPPAPAGSGPEAGPSDGPGDDAGEPGDADYKTLYEREAQRLRSIEGRYRKERQRWRDERQALLGRMDRPDRPADQPAPGDEPETGPRTDDIEPAGTDPAGDRRTLLELIRTEAETAVRPLLRDLGQAIDTQRHVRAIEAAHPDWKDIASGPDLDSWIDEQPDYLAQVLRDVVERGRAEQVIDLLGHYKGARRLKDAARSNAEHSARRERQALGATAVPSRHAGPPTGRPDPDDFSAAWSEAVAKSRRP